MTSKLFYKGCFLVTFLINCICSGYSQSVAEYKINLEKAASPNAKADACFDIAQAFSQALKLDSAFFYTNKIKEFSQQANYEQGIGKYHLSQAIALFYRNKKDESQENVLKAIEIFTRLKETQWMGRSYLVLGSNQNVTNKIPLARKSYWAAIDCFTAIDDAKGLYSAYRWIAYSYFETSETDSASFYQIKGLAMAERLNEPEKIYQAAGWMGSTYLSFKEFDKAIRYFEYALKYQNSKSDKVGLRSFLTDYATCLIITKKFSLADSVIMQIESLNAILKDPYGETAINQLKGTSEFQKKNYAEAVRYLRQASEKMEDLNVLNDNAKNILLLLGKAEYETLNYDSAIYHLQLSNQMSESLGDLIGQEEDQLMISKAFQQKKQSDSALYYFKNYVALKDSLFSLQKQKNIIDITARYETEKKEQSIRILEKEKEANFYLLQLKNQQLEKQQLQGEKKSQQLALISKQNEINKLDADQKSLSLDIVKKENAQRRANETLLEKEAGYQKLLFAKQSQQKKIIYAGITVVMLLAGYGLYRYLRKKKFQNQQEVLNERLRISRELHDEVGATLSGVALFSEIARQKMEEKRTTDAELYLNHISANSKEMVEKMSDIVWAINPNNDSFERIIAKLQTFAFNLCAGKGISLQLDIDDAIRNYYPAMHVKKNLYLFMKEAINNAVKYSAGKNIFLTLKKRDNYITAEIRDDGKGFNTSTDYTGNGLKNMKARADNISAVYLVKSQEGQGTSVSIQFQFHPAGGHPAAV